MKIMRTLGLILTLGPVTCGQTQTPRPTLADASARVTEMNGGRPVDCTANKVKINFGSGRGEGYCQAVLADLVKSWENGSDLGSLDTLSPVEKMPAAPSDAYELKGDKLGTSMAEYLRRHPNDCVKEFSTPPEVHRSVLSGNKLEHTGYQHVNAFRFACQNLDKSATPGILEFNNPVLVHSFAQALSIAPTKPDQTITLASAPMFREQIEFSQQQLYLVAYYFKQGLFPLVQVAFIQKFGSPTTTNQTTVQNKLGAQFTRTTLTWKNGVSTIELSEIAGDDLNMSQAVMILDGIYTAVLQREGGKTAQSSPERYVELSDES